MGKSLKWISFPIVIVAGVGIYLVAKNASKPKVVSQSDSRFKTVHSIIEKHCVSCHSSKPTDPTFGIAPGGVSFDEVSQIKAFKERIRVRVLLTKTMPPIIGSKTKMTPQERDKIQQWIEAETSVDIPEI